MNQTNELETNSWYKALKVILYALLLTPIWFWSIFLFPFITTKVFYLRILVEVALAIYLVLAFRYPEIRPKWNWLLKSVWIYMLVIIVTSLFGVNIDKSFLGTVERGEGIITMLHYAVYFTILVSVFRTGKEWYRFLMSAVGVIGFIGVYGLLQLTGSEFVTSAGGTRISGTIGNAAFFAAVMLFGIFLSTFLLYHPRTKKSRDKQIYLSLVLIVTFLATYASQTRGALVALGLAAIVYLLFLAFKSRKNRTRVVAGLVLAALVLGVVGIFVGKESQFVQSQNTLRRIATISPTDITTQSRFDTWSASWQGWQDRFLLGYGYENYNIAFNKYFPARIFKDQGSQLWFDRAHNIIFDIGVASGIVGLVSYLAIFALSAWILYKLYRKISSAEDGSGLRWELPVLLVLALAAYFIQNFFVFDTHATYLFFFVVLAYIAFLSNSYFPRENQAEPRVLRPNFFVVIVLAVLTFFVIYFVNLEPAFANRGSVRGILAARTGQFREVHPEFAKSLSYGTYMDEEIRQRLVDFANEAAASGQLSPQEQAELYMFTIDELQKSIEESKQDVKNYLFLMTVYNRARSLDPAFSDLTLALGERAVELSPTRPQIYFEIGQAYFNKDEPERAIEQFEKALALNPEPKESHFNLAVAAIIAGREDLVERQLSYIEESETYKLTVSDYLVLSRAYRNVGAMDKFIEMHEKASELDQETAENYARLAAAYGEVCDVASARAATDRAVEINPSFAADARIFITQLEERCSQ